MNLPAQTSSSQPSWLDAAKAQLPRPCPGAEPQTLSGSALTLTLAVQLAEAGFQRPRTVSQAIPEKPEGQGREAEIEWAKSRKALREQMNRDAALLRMAPDAALKVGAAHALLQVVARLRETGTEPGVADIQRALCAPTGEPSPLVADGDPDAQRLSGPWVDKVRFTLRAWAQRLGRLFAPEPWQGQTWNRVWSNATALTELDRWLGLSGADVPGECPSRCERVVQAMLRPDRPQAKFSTANRGTLTCLPTDKAKPVLVVRLQLDHWLAEALDPGEGLALEHPSQQALRSLRFRVSGLGDRSNSDVYRSNGLRVDHLYLAVFIQRLGQCLGPATHPPMNIPPLFDSAVPPVQPPANLPAELHQTLDPGEWPAALAGIAQLQANALAAHRAHAAGNTVRPLDKQPPRQPHLTTRRAAPVLDRVLPHLRALPADMIRWQAPAEPDADSLGTLWLSPAALNPAQPPQYTDCLVLVQYERRWYAVRPELLQEGEGELAEQAERVGLWAYAPLPDALQVAGGWPVLAQAMPGAGWVGHFRGAGLLLVAALSLDRAVQ